MCEISAFFFKGFFFQCVSPLVGTRVFFKGKLVSGGNFAETGECAVCSLKVSYTEMF